MSAVLTITRGYPGSGKTTWAQQIVAKYPGKTVRVNRDDMRRDIFGGGGKLSHEDEQEVSRLQKATVRSLLRAGKHVIVDDTNLKLRFARDWANLAAAEGVDFEVLHFTMPVETCIARDAERIWGHVGRKVIEEKARRFPYGGASWGPVVADAEKPSGLEVVPYDNDPSLEPAIIVDIDGTLANHEGVRSPYDYTKVAGDTLHEDIAEVVKALSKQWSCTVIVVSGREGTAQCRRDTYRWLIEHSTQPDMLLMRAEGDKRRDDVIKHEIFQDHIAGQYHIKAVLDDRDRVVAMWRALGLRTLQVAPGAF